MADQAPQPSKKRRLRKAPETVRQHSAGPVTGAAPKQPSKFKAFWRRIGQFPIWRPFKFIGRFIVPRYIKGAAHELRLVTWPNWKQSLRLTEAVILFAVVFGILVAIFDYGLDRLFKEIVAK